VAYKMNNINMEDINYWEAKFKYCNYSNKLLSKLIMLNSNAKEKINLNEIKKAIYYAKKYHKEQKRQSGEPYYSHPLEVASMVSDYLFRTDIIVTSILHDTIEDTLLTQKMIACIFDQRISDQVEDLTRVKADRKISSAELIESLWHEKKYDILLIKQFDRVHNMLTIKAKNPEKIKKITEETLNEFIILSIFLETKDIELKLTELCMKIVNQETLLSADPFGNDDNLLSLLFENDATHK
jgi:(p)ppGpp synthase/HD superfamily hydrolase